MDFLREADRRALQWVYWSRRQRLIRGETTQLEVIVHGDVGSQHLQVQVFHCLWGRPWRSYYNTLSKPCWFNKFKRVRLSIITCVVKGVLGSVSMVKSFSTKSSLKSELMSESIQKQRSCGPSTLKDTGVKLNSLPGHMNSLLMGIFQTAVWQ